MANLGHKIWIWKVNQEVGVESAIAKGYRFHEICHCSCAPQALRYAHCGASSCVQTWCKDTKNSRCVTHFHRLFLLND